MRKRIALIISSLLILLSSFVLMSCGDKPAEAVALSSPTGLRVSEGILSWDSVANASSYDVTVNGETSNTGFTNYIVYTFENKNATGVYEIAIVAKPSITNKAKKASVATTLSYTVVPTAYRDLSVKSVTGKTLEFNPVDNSVNYSLSYGLVGGAMEEKVITATNYDFSALSVGEYSLEMKVKGDGIYYLDSPSTLLEMVVEADKLSLRIARPTGFVVKDNILSWTPNALALSYKLEDVYGNITYATTPEWKLEEKYLIHSVAAYSSSSLISTSITQTGINYLDGAGAELDPFIIDDAFDFRAIDYYERKYVDETGKYAKRYYKVKNDITFPPPKSEQENRNLHKIEAFRGELDGGNFKLIGISVNNVSGAFALFEEIMAGAVVKDLTLEQMQISNYLVIDGDGNYKPLGAMMAGVAITNRGQITNVKIDRCKLQAMSIVAGVACFNYGTISNCVVNEGVAKVIPPPKGVNPKNESAGIVVVNEGTVDNCKVLGTRIQGFRTIGGLISINRESGKLTNSTCSALISVFEGLTKDEVGGLVGYNGGSVKGCTNDSDITISIGKGNPVETV